MERDVYQQADGDVSLSEASDSDDCWPEDVPQRIDLPSWPAFATQIGGASEYKDVSAAELAKGKDPQGINWDTLEHTREGVRERRTEAYENYLNLPREVSEFWGQQEADEGIIYEKDANFFPFHSYKNDTSISVLHFQLRNLLWATSAFEYYFLSDSCVCLYDSLKRTTKKILNLNGQWNGASAVAHDLGRVLVSTICVSHGLIAAGGFYGELVVSNMEGSVQCSKVMTREESGITNGIEVFETSSGDVRLVAANNDNVLRMFSADSFKACGTIVAPWATNWVTPSPDGGSLLAVVGDNPQGLLFESSTGKVAAKLEGHLDFSFAAAWHPSGTYLATGNQDTSTRIWDLRWLDKAVTEIHTTKAESMIPGQMSAVRSLRFSPDGKYLAIAEAADFVNLFEASKDYTRAQQIDFFSEIAGITFSPDSSSFMVSLHDDTYGGFMQFQQSTPKSVLFEPQPEPYDDRYRKYREFQDDIAKVFTFVPQLG